MRIEFYAKVLNGLPVYVEANLHRGDADIGEPARYAEVQRIYFAEPRRNKQGKRVYRELPPSMWAKVDIETLEYEATQQ